MTATGQDQDVGVTSWETLKGKNVAGVPVGGLNACKERETWREQMKMLGGPSAGCHEGMLEPPSGR